MGALIAFLVSSFWNSGNDQIFTFEYFHERYISQSGELITTNVTRQFKYCKSWRKLCANNVAIVNCFALQPKSLIQTVSFDANCVMKSFLFQRIS